MNKKEKQPAKFELLQQRCRTVDSLLINVKHLAEKDRQMTISKENNEFVIHYNSGPSEQ